MKEKKTQSKKEQEPLPKECRRRKGQSVADWLKEQLFYSYLDARKCKRGTRDQYRFELNVADNIKQMVYDILGRFYDPNRGIAFIVHDPVIREIFAAPFKDRIIHHALFRMVAGWWDRRLIYDSSSCRPGKGVLCGILRLQKKMNQAQREYQEPIWIIKMDIQGYFMSLPRKKLYERVCWGLDRQFHGRRPIEYWIIRFLWKKVIFDDPTKGVQRRGRLSEWADLPLAKSLFHQPKGKGIVIGNLSSQLLSNIYLDTLDRFVIYTLGYKYYGRYVDDFYILVPESQLDQALKDVNAIKELLTGLELKLHPKKFYVQKVTKGVTFLGARVYPNRVLPGARLTRRYKNAVYKVVTGQLDPDVLFSYRGYFKHMKSENIERQIFEIAGWDWNWEDRRRKNQRKKASSAAKKKSA